MRALIKQGLIDMGLEQRVPQGAAEHLARYGQMLLEKNQVMNLTAITEPDQVAQLHMLDCAALLQSCDFQNKRLLDVGTGAGFPGMVLKILVPSLDVTLLDSLNKRLDWLEEISTTLCLRDVRTVHARAEEKAADPDFREGFDFVTSRAVADLRMLCELCLPYVRPGGVLLAMKSREYEEELSAAAHAITALCARVENIWDYTIEGAGLSYCVIVIQKLANTPAKYPRRFAKIQKNPL